ncbi:hypothetical protein E4T49_04341 [Aureobasidium sp. EXF-10728]|nr:hypothetical protein E4T49_04341 [Aureobasidium sp. EXF-10728]
MTHPIAKPWRFDAPSNETPPICTNQGKKHQKPYLSLTYNNHLSHLLLLQVFKDGELITTTEPALRHQPAAHAAFRRQSPLPGMHQSVNQYHESAALLSLFHNFPSSQNQQTTQVDISQLLDTIDHQHLQIGAWLNVIGYVTPSTLKSRSKIQAVVVWSAGAINLQQYENALMSRQTT